jgi:hypothetical protein
MIFWVTTGRKATTSRSTTTASGRRVGAAQEIEGVAALHELVAEFTDGPARSWSASRPRAAAPRPLHTSGISPRLA